MKPLSDWLAWAHTLDAIYQEELGRSAFSDTEAFVTWTWHWAGGQSPEWVRARIRESAEAQGRQQGITPTPPASGPAPLPPLAGGRVIRVADHSVGPFHPRMYSYWSNAWLESAGRVVVFAGHATDGRARFFRVDLASGSVESLGALLPHASTTEGWSWDSAGRISFADGPRLLRVNPFNGVEEVVLDISEPHPGCRLWQSHSSDDGATHCATLERVVSSGPYERLGTIALRHGRRTFYPAEGRLDESQIAGRFLIIKEERERDGRWRLDNRIVALDSGAQRWLADEEGAVGHSDAADSWLVGEDDQRGACVLWNLERLEDGPRMLFSTWNMGHVSVRNGRILLSDDKQVGLVAPDGAGVTTLLEHGAHVVDYDSQVRANLDPTGSVACFMVGGDVLLLVP